jgi:Protein of unknown function (DUF1615)
MPFSRRFAWLFLLAAAALAGCASEVGMREPPPLRPAEVRAQIVSLLPSATADRAGWAVDIYAAFAALGIPPTTPNICAVLAVTEQESSFRADPAVPNLGKIARAEIDRRAERAGVPALAVDFALKLRSSAGKSYGERIDAVWTERELSEIFEDFIGMVPLGKRLFADWNPVRTGGPMQVSIAFAEAHAQQRSYLYPLAGSIRHEVFTRRGGLYFGIAHLLDYPIGYDKLLYRFADYNAGHYASRNAAFQSAVSVASGIPLDLDGDLVRRGGAESKPGSTELAVRSLGKQLGMSEQAIRRALEQDNSAEFERSTLYRRVFELAERLERRPLPRAVVPNIKLQGPKISRKLTTDWFARRVDERHRRCLARMVAFDAADAAAPFRVASAFE